MVPDAAAIGDRVAREIFQQEVRELARTAAAAVRRGGLSPDGVPVALAGGLLTHSTFFRDEFLRQLRGCGVAPGPVGVVNDPALGALVLARKLVGKQ